MNKPISNQSKKQQRDSREPYVVPALGVDIGRVLVQGGGSDTNFFAHDEEEAMRTPEMPDAFDAVARLFHAFEGRVWLVSKCGPKIQARSRVWLARNRFWTRTGVPEEHLHFCLQRREKAAIAARLVLTHFVDDRTDVLFSMVGIVPCRFLFGSTPSTHGNASAHGALSVPTWLDAERAIMSTLPPDLTP